MKAADNNARKWYVLCTKPRHEKKVANLLTQAGYRVYCPLQKVVRKWSDRTKEIEEPLFKGYVFIRTEVQKRDEVFAIPGTVRYLFWLGRPAIVREEEISIIQKWLGHYDHKRLNVGAIHPGTNVRINSGKFINEEGVLLDASKSRALVKLKGLGIQLSLDLTQNELQAIQSPSLKVLTKVK